ncbi:MAG: hypothetical protein ACFFED_04090 [Candidatus Thorarchaeota archaeon]
MNDDAMTAHVSAAIPYVDDPSIVFRVAWYAVASSPGVYLSNYSEPESQEFQGSASFTVRTENTSMEVNISVIGEKSNIEIDIKGQNDEELNTYLQELSTEINNSLDRYRVLGTNQKSRVRRALVAKTCWDRLVFLILKKQPLAEVYYQVAHGREMMIKATEGESLHPITLHTSGWLSQFESLPREDPLPGDLATALAKKSVEWKQETIEVIKRYI